MPAQFVRLSGEEREHLEALIRKRKSAAHTKRPEEYVESETNYPTLQARQPDLTSEEVPALEALAAAVQLANSKKIPIVGIDPDRVWRSECGDFWRYQEDG